MILNSSITVPNVFNFFDNLILLYNFIDFNPQLNSTTTNLKDGINFSFVNFTIFQN